MGLNVLQTDKACKILATGWQQAHSIGTNILATLEELFQQFYQYFKAKLRAAIIDFLTSDA